MRASYDTYQKVAEHCSAYEPTTGRSSVSNSYSEPAVSCTTCRHFDPEKYCRLDLYDKIVKNHELG